MWTQRSMGLGQWLAWAAVPNRGTPGPCERSGSMAGLLPAPLLPVMKSMEEGGGKHRSAKHMTCKSTSQACIRQQGSSRHTRPPATLAAEEQ